MGSWAYGGQQHAGCEEKPTTTLYIGSCDGKCVHVVVRTETGTDDDEIGSIHVPNEVIPGVIKALLTYCMRDSEEILTEVQEELGLDAVMTTRLRRNPDYRRALAEADAERWAAEPPVSVEEMFVAADGRRRSHGR